MAKFHYKVAVGKHREDGKVYSEGQIISSDKRLDLTFPNKFTMVKAPHAGAEVVDTEEIPDPEHTFEKEEEIELELVEHRGGWYDVINTATGEPINERKLRREAALGLMGLTEEEIDDEE